MKRAYSLRLSLSFAYPIIHAALAFAPGDGYVLWCLDHYRSYNPRTNTWVSYSGEIRECVSPY